MEGNDTPLSTAKSEMAVLTLPPTKPLIPPASFMPPEPPAILCRDRPRLPTQRERRAAQRRTKVTGVVGNVASAAVNRTLSTGRYFKKRAKQVARFTAGLFTGPLKYMGVMETSRARLKRRRDELRWDGLRERLMRLHKDNHRLALRDLPAVCCPITGLPMRDPVICPEGQSFERQAIELWLDKEPTNPMTRHPLTKEELVPNRALKDTMRQVHDVTYELARVAARTDTTGTKNGGQHHATLRRHHLNQT
jgi:hypothetical protein